MWYRTSGPWGPGAGANLTATQFDENTWDTQQQIAAKAQQGVGLENFVVSGNELWAVLTDHTMLGPYTLPVATLQFKGEWVPHYYYTANDIITANGSTYTVLLNHTSAATFDPGANDGSGHDFYGLLLSVPAGALPAGGTTGQVLTKAGTADYVTDWASPTLAGLSDVDQVTIPHTGWIVYWDGSEFSYRAESPGGSTTFTGLTDVLASPAPALGQLVYWNGSKFTYETMTSSLVTDFDFTSGLNQGDGLAYDTSEAKFKNVQPLRYQQPSGGMTFALGDENTLFDYSNSTPANFTIPPNASVAFAQGTLIGLRAYSTGQATFTAGAGVILHYAGGRLPKTRATGSTIWAQQESTTDRWTIFGDLDYNSADGNYVISDSQSINPALVDGDLFTWTPASNNTITMAAAPYGKRMTILITTSGTTSYTLTFGSGFKTTGTLTTGTVTAKKFTISFIGDGTNMNELHRTTAM